LSYGPEQQWVSFAEPRYVLEIARLLDRLGDKQNALKEYQRFLEFWKSADSDLPELAETRRAVERLRSAAEFRRAPWNNRTSEQQRSGRNADGIVKRSG
jgi:hypothetical protein